MINVKNIVPCDNFDGIGAEFEELHWFCSESGHREAFVYYYGGHWNEYMVKMVEVERDGKGGIHDIHRTKEIRPMGNHSERYAEDCAENWVLGVL